MTIERVFQLLAAILAGIAAYFFLNENKDGMFVAAVFSAVAFLLSVRFQAKRRNRERDAESDAMQTASDPDASADD